MLTDQPGRHHHLNISLEMLLPNPAPDIKIIIKLAPCIFTFSELGKFTFIIYQ